ncbi:hypothetical protein [Pseudomonas sp. QD4]|uniref:hypothetical protein n=1 Tax=Pseudomonas sp. QD4 TaxID=3368618 RepID=UPI003B9DD098
MRNYAAQVLVHRAEREVWINLCGYSVCGLLIAEVKSLQITTSLFLARELKAPIIKPGQVELHGHVATDLARELTDSQPKIEQVLLLLMGNTAVWPGDLLPALVMQTRWATRHRSG